VSPSLLITTFTLRSLGRLLRTTPLMIPPTRAGFGDLCLGFLKANITVFLFRTATTRASALLRTPLNLGRLTVTTALPRPSSIPTDRAGDKGKKWYDKDYLVRLPG
jgi:hypothetical protein